MKKTLFLLLALLMVGSGFAQRAPQTKLVSSSEERIVVNFHLNGFNTTKVQTPQGDQFIVSAPKMAAMLEAGAPELPSFPIPTIIGDRAEMTVSVIDAQYTDYHMSIAPSKGNISRQVNPEDVPFTYGEMYKQDAFWPATQAVLNAPYIIRDFRGQNIMVSPFAYNPVSQTLRVYTDLTIEMTKVSDNGENQKAARRSNTIKVDPEQKAAYAHRFINFGETSARYTFDEDFGEMLIICADMYMSNVQPLVDWKNQSGRPTTMVSLSEAGGNNIENIKTFVTNYYNDPDHNLEFLLLVGEYNDITPKNYGSGSGGTCYSDNYLGKLEGSDNYLEVLVGRFSVANAADADLQVGKTIYYERDVEAGAAWGSKGMGIGYYGAGSGHFGEDDYQHIDYIRDTLLHYTYSQVIEHHGGSGGDASVATISGTVNDGISIINYCNHGSETSWGVANYSVSNVNALTNDNMLPVVWSVACLNGKFDVGTCFGESWLRAKNNATGAPTGAVAGMFSFVSQPWVPPMYGQDEMVDILAEWRHTDIFHHTIGGASLNGSMYVLDMAPGDSYQTFNTWLLFGDPSAIIRTAAPAEMNVTVSPSVLMLGMTEAQISVDADYAIATLSMDGEILASARVENGQCNMTFPALSNVGNAELVILGFNKATYMGEIEVVPAEGAFITVNDYVLLNAEQANYGETVDLDINVKNVGVEVANNLTGTLTTECPYVEILSDQATIAEISPDEIVTLEGFQFSVAEDVPDGTVAQFFLNVSDGTNEWEGKFNIVLHAPVVAFDFIDNDGEMLEFHFSNYGSAPFYGGTFNIYSSSADLIFAEDEIIFNDTVNGLESITLEMPYSFADGVEPGTTFQVAYELTCGLQLVAGDYVLTFGTIMDDFETGEFGNGWTLSAQYPWTIAAEGRNGYCAKSANAGANNSEGYCELTIAVLAEGNLTFWYKVSSEQNYDKLHFYMDGQEKQQWSGTIDWTEYTQPVTTGVHTFKWSYTKDVSVNSGSDCAWIDDIQFPPVSVMSFIDPVNNLNAELTGMTVNLTWEATPDVESFLIKRNDEVIATVTETNFSEYVNEGIYKYSVFAKIGDQISRPESVMVQVMYDGAEETQEANFSVYPNPTKGVLNINAGNSNFEYSLFNGMGQQVAEGNGQGTETINVGNMSKGVYFLRLTSGSQTSIQKVVVE